MFLSVIVPVYNTNIELFKRCIDSICKINSNNYEVIIIDDGSLDENTNLYKKYIENMSQVCFYKRKNEGVSSARNFGIDVSNGKYILFVDSDDELLFKNIDWNVLNDDYDLIVYNYTMIKSNKIHEVKELECGETGPVDFNDLLYRFIVDDKFYTPFSKFIKKSFLIKNNISFRTKMINGEDAIFNLDMFCNFPKIYYINKSMYNYYFVSSNYSNRIRKNFQKILNDYYYKYERKKSVIEKMCYPKNIISIVQNKAVSQAFRVSIICAGYNMHKSDEIYEYLKKFNVNFSILSLKNKIKYSFIKKKKRIVFKFLSIIRDVHIKLKRV